MLRRLLIVPALLAGITLGGCATTGGAGAGGVSETISQIQSVAQQVCGFVPTATTVARVITTFTGGGGAVDMVSQIASGICAAVASAPKSMVRGKKRLARAPVYRGVRIQGSFSR